MRLFPLGVFCSSCLCMMVCANYYIPYHGSTVGYGNVNNFNSRGFSGIFGFMIYLFIFIILIEVLFGSSKGIGGYDKGHGIGTLKNKEKHGDNYGYYQGNDYGRKSKYGDKYGSHEGNEYGSEYENELLKWYSERNGYNLGYGYGNRAGSFRGKVGQGDNKEDNKGIKHGRLNVKNILANNINEVYY